MLIIDLGCIAAIRAGALHLFSEKHNRTSCLLFYPIINYIFHKSYREFVFYCENNDRKQCSGEDNQRNMDLISPKCVPDCCQEDTKQHLQAFSPDVMAKQLARNGLGLQKDTHAAEGEHGACQ